MPFCAPPADRIEGIIPVQNDARATMTVESTAVCDQQTAESAGRALGRSYVIQGMQMLAVTWTNDA
jgi:hypothetical protein